MQGNTIIFPIPCKGLYRGMPKALHDQSKGLYRGMPKALQGMGKNL